MLKHRNIRIMLTQACTVLVMSAGAGYVLYEQSGMIAIPLAIGLLIFGIVSIMYPKIHPAFFSILTLLACLFEFFTHSLLGLDTPRFQGMVHYTPIYEDVHAGLSLTVDLLIGMLLFAGYLMLSHLRSLERDFEVMVSAKTDDDEITFMMGKNLKLVLLFTGISLAVSAAVMLLLLPTQSALASFFETIPSTNLLFGLAGIVVLAGFIYYIFRSTRREQQQ